MKNSNPLLRPIFLVALLPLAVITLYAGSYSAPFVFDDLALFGTPEVITKYGHSFFNFDLRWLPYASFGWTANWFGLDLFWLRLGNILLHAANAIALFFLLRRLFQATLTGADAATGTAPSPSSEPLRQAQDRLRTRLTWFAFFGALLFALHPIAVYGVSYLIQRSILMATLFVLLMLLAYLEGLLRACPDETTSHSTRLSTDDNQVAGYEPGRRGSWRWMLAAAACYFAAVYSKEHSIMAPGVALAMTFLIRKPSVALFKLITPYYILSALIAVTVLLSVKGVLGELYEPRAAAILSQMGLLDLPNVQWLSILTQSWLFFKYLGLWLLPNPAWMSVDMREPFAMSWLSWPQTLGFAAFLAYPCVAAWLLLKRGRMGLLGFALLFPWILFLTEWSTIRVQESFVLYRSYLWLPGLLAALPVVLGWLAPQRAYLLLGAVCLLLVPLTLNRLNTFSSSFLLWGDAEKLVRDKADVFGIERIYFFNGIELLQLKRYDEAIASFSKAISTFPRDDYMYINRAGAYFFLGKHQEALRDFDRAVALKPDNPKPYYGRALVYRALGDFPAAREDFSKSCALGGLCQ